MKDFSNFVEGWWQLVFKTHECLELCRPMGSSSWNYFLMQANLQYYEDDEQMIKAYGHTKRCGVCDIPMSGYKAIREKIGEEMEASWKREAEINDQEIMILCVYCLELMEVKEKGMTSGTTVKLATTNKLIDILQKHPDSDPDYFRDLKRRPLCVH